MAHVGMGRQEAAEHEVVESRHEGHAGVSVHASLDTLPVQEALVLTATHFLTSPVLVPGAHETASIVVPEGQEVRN